MITRRLFHLLLTLPIALSVSAQRDTKLPTGAVQGTLEDRLTALPVARATLTLTPGFGDDLPAVTVSSDINGKFSFGEVLPGAYFLSVKKDGYIDGLYGSRSLGEPGIPLNVRANETIGGLSFPILHGAVISGTVQNEDGEPFANVTVKALQYVYSSSGKKLLAVASVFTNDRGEYRLHGLLPGRYLVACYTKRDRALTEAGKTFPGRYPVTYYPAVTSVENATSLALATGNEFLANFTLAASRAFSVHGKIVGLDPGPRATASLLPTTATDDPPQSVQVEENNSFVINGALPGNYKIFATGRSSGTIGRALKKITIEDGDLNDVLLEIEKPPPPISGRVYGLRLSSIRKSREKDGSVPRLTVTLLPALTDDVDDDDDVAANAPDRPRGGSPQVDIDGAFSAATLEHLSKSVFATVSIASAGFEDWYVESVTCFGRDVTNSGFNPYPGGMLQIVMSPSGGQVEGTALTSNGTALPGATVLLFPDESRQARPDLYHVTRTDQDGYFKVRGVAPGSYRLLAWTQVESPALRDPAFLKNYEHEMQSLSVEKMGKYQVSIPAIPSLYALDSHN